MFLLGQLRTTDGRTQETARIRNISSGGLMAECAWPEGPEAPIVMEIKGLGPIIGKVAWNDGKHIGMTFDVPIDPKLARKPAPSAAPVATWPPYMIIEKLPPKRRYPKPRF